MSKNNCVVSLSGGMDSSTLLLRAISEYKFVTGISFDYGQKHRVELDRAQSLVNYLSDKGIIVNYRQIKLDGLTDLLNSALVTGGKDVPEGHYENENMKETVVPNRNKMFASITQAVALSVANRTEKDSGNSDYKSASSVERIEAFIDLGRKDPVQYEDETGPVDWEVAKSSVIKVLAENQNAATLSED